MRRMSLRLLWEAIKIGFKETLYGKPKPKKRGRRVRRKRRYYPVFGFTDEEEILSGFQAEMGDPTEPIDDFLADMNGGSL